MWDTCKSGRCALPDEVVHVCCRKQDGSMIWRESEQRSQHREYPWTLGSMQIYGSYRYRRDFIEAVKCPGSLSRTRPLKVGRRKSCCFLSEMLCCP